MVSGDAKDAVSRAYGINFEAGDDSDAFQNVEIQALEVGLQAFELSGVCVGGYSNGRIALRPRNHEIEMADGDRDSLAHVYLYLYGIFCLN